MVCTLMKVNDRQTTNYERLTVIRNMIRIVDIVNPTTEDIDAYNKKYPLAIATYAHPNEI